MDKIDLDSVSVSLSVILLVVVVVALIGVASLFPGIVLGDPFSVQENNTTGPWWERPTTSVFDTAQYDSSESFNDSSGEYIPISRLSGKTPSEAKQLLKENDVVYWETTPSVSLRDANQNTTTEYNLSDLYIDEIKRAFRDTAQTNGTSITLDSTPDLKDGRYIRDFHITRLAVPGSALLRDSGGSDMYVIPPRGQSIAFSDYRVIDRNWCTSGVPAENNTLDSNFGENLTGLYRTCASENTTVLKENHTVRVGGEEFIGEIQRTNIPQESTVPYGDIEFSEQSEETVFQNRMTLSVKVVRNVTVEHYNKTEGENSTAGEWEKVEQFTEEELFRPATVDQTRARFIATDALQARQTIYKEQDGDTRVRIDFPGEKLFHDEGKLNTLLWTYIDFEGDERVTNVWRAFSITGPQNDVIVHDEESEMRFGMLRFPQLYVSPMQESVRNGLFTGRMYRTDGLTHLTNGWEPPHQNIAMEPSDTVQTLDRMVFDLTDASVNTTIYDITGNEVSVVTTRKEVNPTRIDAEAVNGTVTFRLHSGGKPLRGVNLTVETDEIQVLTTDTNGEVTVEHSGGTVDAEYSGYSPFSPESGEVYESATASITPSSSGGLPDAINEAVGVLKAFMGLLVIFGTLYFLLRFF